MISDMKRLNPEQEGLFAVIAALIVLFSAMWDPEISVVVSVAALVLYAIYRLVQK
jgi:hypothetical protein